MDKISFPKGSLKFIKNNIDEPPEVPFDFKMYYKRDKFAKLIEKNYPHSIKEGLPSDILHGIQSNAGELSSARQLINSVKTNDLTNNYKVIFKHPRWAPLIGEIIVESKRQNLRETMRLIASEFKSKKDAYRNKRVRTKKVKIESLRTHIEYNVSGGCIYMPNLSQGVFIKFLKDQEKQIVFAPKYPKETNAKYVGVELEFLAPINQDTLGLKLYSAGVGKYVTLKTDGSLKCSHGNTPDQCREHIGKEWAHELCIIATEGEFKDIIQKVCKVLNDEGCTVNKTCGMHVHVDCRNRDVEKVYQNLLSSQGILLRMNPKSRTETYAKLNKERDFAAACSQDGRYYAINAKAYDKFKTIEVRVHAGTVDFTKIFNWVSILVSIANTVERYTRSFNTVPTFLKRFGITDDSIKAYIQERIDKFNIKVDEVSGSEMIPEAERGVA